MSTETLDYQELIDGKIPPYIMRFIKQAGRTINSFNMIQENDEVLLGVSGGKDSLALALALSLRRKWLPVDYKLRALMINWIEHPITEEAKERLYKYFSDLSIDFKIIDESQFPTSFKDDFNCYLCSRNRRRILFQYAAEHNEKLIALGHHLDDLVETTFMNLCFRADFSTMLPVQEFFDGKLHIIRPLIEVHENTLLRISQAYNLPVVKPVCPYDQSNIRAKLKPIIREFKHIDKLTMEHIFKAHEFDCSLDKKL
ncbi:MAG: adenine nucleotide alpha hydrolase [Spirochaetales bacterium]|nr:adenine nucleotide alpha hydrolase [Spirochaetales bacterium]